MKHIQLFEKFIDSNTDIKLEDLTNNMTKIDVGNVIALLEKHVNEIGENYVNHVKSKLNGDVRRISEELSNKIGLKEVLVGDWVYPFNQDYILNEFLISALVNLIRHDIIAEEEMIKLFNVYKTLNPIIDTIPRNDYYDCYEIILGMTSGFNFDDIHDFVVLGGGGKRSEEYLTKHRFAASLVGDIQYVPSEKTLDAIIKHQLG